MSESLTKERPSVELDDFERRYHQQHASHQGNDDPLAELARLVGEHPDPYGDVFAQEEAAHAAAIHTATAPTQEASPYAIAAHHGYDPSRRREPAFDALDHNPRLSGDFAAIEAGLRGAFAAHPESAAPAASTGAAEGHEFYAQQDAYSSDAAYAANQPAYAQEYPAGSFAAAPPKPGLAQSLMGRARRPTYTVAATIAVGVIGVGIAFAFKGISSSPSAVKTIAAASGPTKIQPPADAGDQAAHDSAMLGKKNQDAPTQLVSREEQPVDLSQAVQENASRNADAGGGAPGDASNVPVPPSPSQAAQGADQMGFGAGMPAPKRVKVVSVRPDGTVVSNDSPPAAALPAQRQVASAESQDPIARASAPKAGASENPKSTTRIGAAPTRSADDSDDRAERLAHKAKQKLASAETTDDAAASHSGGGFAVQLAAPGTEADARSASSRLSKKFSAALSGHRLGFHKAQSNGKSVYRVRVSKLSKEDATSLCEKLKAGGGSCFVAKNN